VNAIHQHHNLTCDAHILEASRWIYLKWTRASFSIAKWVNLVVSIKCQNGIIRYHGSSKSVCILMVLWSLPIVCYIVQVTYKLRVLLSLGAIITSWYIKLVWYFKCIPACTNLYVCWEPIDAKMSCITSHMPLVIYAYCSSVDIYGPIICLLQYHLIWPQSSS